LPAWGRRDGFNGHAWSSPRLAGKMAQAIGEGLAEADRPRAARYRAQADAYADELYRLADEYYTAAAPLQGQRVVLSHTSLAYLARDLELTVVATLHDEDEAEPTPRGLARLIDAVRDDGAQAILVDPQDRGRLAPLVAAETGVTRLLTLDPAAAGSLEPGAYLATMRRNLETIRTWAAEVAKEPPADKGALDAASAGHATP
jgi:ABC-type Zn uptake system ZnuABC Zn-binding protein ZnuA